MPTTVMRYQFADTAEMDDVECSLVLALFAVESLHGESRVRLEASHYLEREQRVCVIDSTTVVGFDFAKVFTGFLRREFGPEAFTVRRVQREADPERQASGV